MAQIRKEISKVPGLNKAGAPNTRWLLVRQYGERVRVEQTPSPNAVERTNDAGVVWRILYEGDEPVKAWRKEVEVEGEWVPATRERVAA